MKKLAIMLSVLLSLSVVGNVLQYMLYNKNYQEAVPVQFTNANSRDTYYTIHNIAEAHKTSRGKGVKVGIIDWSFGYDEHKNLYKQLIDFTDNPNNYTNGHGNWMATVLLEIAPECEVYALATGLASYDEGKFVDVLIEAIDWSIENDIDILTLSLQAFSEVGRVRIDEAVGRAIAHGIVTTFIHYDNPNNILPFGLLNYDDDFISYAREPDINVFHYDYNMLFPDKYLEYLKSDPPASYDDIKNGGYIPFVSFSSMSPVTAGFVALLKSVNNTLTPAEYKEILIQTSYAMHFSGGVADFEDANVKHVVDIGNAVKYLEENYK